MLGHRTGRGRAWWGTPFVAAAGLALAACGFGVPSAGAPAGGTGAGAAAVLRPALSLPAPSAVHATSATSQAGVAGSVQRLGIEALEEALFARVNADRAAHGLAPLVNDPQLREIARERAAAQAGRPLSHDDDLGAYAFTRLLREAEVTYRLAGENLARPRTAQGESAAETAALAQRALMGSATHRANILTPAFDRMAVGVARDAEGRVTFAQLFRST